MKASLMRNLISLLFGVIATKNARHGEKQIDKYLLALACHTSRGWDWLCERVWKKKQGSCGKMSKRFMQIINYGIVLI